MWSLQRVLATQGIVRVAGVDEVGRGPLAGPVVAAAVVLPVLADPGYRSARRALVGLDDSKKVPPERRAVLAEKIARHAIAWGIGVVEPEAIDRLNILQASFEAMRVALAHLFSESGGLVLDTVLVDGHLEIPGVELRQQALVGGDGLCAAIAAASILAKVHRDHLMDALHERYPAYGFDRHKGYPTPEHLEILRRLGPSEVHRQSFRPVREALTRNLPAPKFHT